MHHTVYKNKYKCIYIVNILCLVYGCTCMAGDADKRTCQKMSNKNDMLPSHIQGIESKEFEPLTGSLKIQ